MCDIRVLEQTAIGCYKRTIGFKLIKCIIAAHLLGSNTTCVYFLQSVLRQKALNQSVLLREFCIQPFKQSVLPWACLKMMENRLVALRKLGTLLVAELSMCYLCMLCCRDLC